MDAAALEIWHGAVAVEGFAAGLVAEVVGQQHPRFDSVKNTLMAAPTDAYDNARGDCREAMDEARPSSSASALPHRPGDSSPLRDRTGWS